jgi:hypothetical protein
MSLNSTEQQTSRPSSAGSNHDDDHLRFERHLSNLNDQPIIWDDPFELLITNEQTGRIGILTEAFSSSPTSRCIREEEFNRNFFFLIPVCFSIKSINFTNSNSITKATR